MGFETALYIYTQAAVVGSRIAGIEIPGAVPTFGAAAILVVAAVVASLVPAARAAKVDVISALRAE